jgi:hypothetical protein
MVVLVGRTVYKVQSFEKARLLDTRETNRYENIACQIVLEDGTKVRGRIFQMVR